MSWGLASCICFIDDYAQMQSSLLFTTIVVVFLVGCDELQKSVSAPEEKPVAEEVKPTTPPKAVTANKGADPDRGTKPEVPTAKAPDISIHRAARQGEIEGIKQHLAAGTDVNAKHDGRTPLHGAALHSRTEITELLIANDADVNSRDVFAVTPLHLAVLGGHKEIAELLIDAGANVNVKNKNGHTPLDTAHKAFRHDSPKVKTFKKEIASLLRKHGGKKGKELKAEGE